LARLGPAEFVAGILIPHVTPALGTESTVGIGGTYAPPQLASGGALQLPSVPHLDFWCRPPMAVRSIAIWDKTSPIQSNNDQVAFAWIITLRTSRGSRVEGERPVLRKTIIVLAAVAALTGTLRDDAVALATGHTGWDGLSDGGGHPLLSQKTPRRVVTPTSHRVRKWWFR
jgi:hypothetical protein